jgi:K+-transporting ATPase ATPase C chain
MPQALRQVVTGLRVLIMLTIVLGIGYPLLLTGLGHAFESQRTGSLVSSGGRVVGSSLIAQPFDADQPYGGDAWFQSRPSAIDDNAQASGGSNKGPNNPDLVATIEQRRAAVAERERVGVDQVPPDAVTASASGLDPFISPAYAELQLPRVARERRLPLEQVRALVAEHTQGRMLGFLGEPRVNVLELDVALQDLSRSRR